LQTAAGHGGQYRGIGCLATYQVLFHR
jgi:hypothetical protein